VLSAALVLVAIYLPALNEPLGTIGLGVSSSVVLVLAVVPFLCVEARQAFSRRAGWTLEGRGRMTEVPRLSKSSRLIRHYLPDLVCRANDGIITTFAVVSGVVGADLSSGSS
jgi:hypothetical protein